METILEEIIVHFRPEPEEELHSAVHALLIKCFQVYNPVQLTTTVARFHARAFVFTSDKNGPPKKLDAMFSTTYRRPNKIAVFCILIISKKRIRSLHIYFEVYMH